MAPSDGPDPDTDPFRPPTIPTQVHCLHCGEEYESYLIEWVEATADDKVEGFWRCPTPDCDGRGFGFDILPTDPDYVGEDDELAWDFDYDDDDDDELDELSNLDGFTELDDLAELDDLDSGGLSDGGADRPSASGADEDDLLW